MIHEYIARDPRSGEIIEVFDVDVPFGQSPPKSAIAPETGLEGVKNFGAAAISIPSHMRAGSADEDSFSAAKRAFSGSSRRNRTSLRDVAKQQLGRQ